MDSEWSFSLDFLRRLSPDANTRIKTDIKVLNLLPSLPLAFVISALWTALVG